VVGDSSGYNVIRPRVLIYIHKALGLYVQQQYLIYIAKICFKINVNKHTILNIHKKSYISKIINYVTYLVFFGSYLVKRDFNIVRYIQASCKRH
jgi:hypothetical protein